MFNKVRLDYFIFFSEVLFSMSKSPMFDIKISALKDAELERLFVKRIGVLGIITQDMEETRLQLEKDRKVVDGFGRLATHDDYLKQGPNVTKVRVASQRLIDSTDQRVQAQFDTDLRERAKQIFDIAQELHSRGIKIPIINVTTFNSRIQKALNEELAKRKPQPAKKQKLPLPKQKLLPRGKRKR